MSLRALRSLVAIAQHGSFARAADAVCLTQSAVSLQIRTLEQEFRAELFNRTHRKVTLTEAGEAAVARAREILALYDGLAAELAAGGGLAGRLRLGAIQTALAGPLPEALAGLRAQHPGLLVHVAAGMSAELALRVEAGELDAAITTEPVRPHPAGLAATPLYADRFWVVAPPASDGVDTATLFANLPFIRFDRRAWAGRMIDAELRRHRVHTHDGMELDSQDAIIAMVARGLGVAVVPLSDTDHAALTDVRCTEFGTPQLTRSVVLLERDDRPQSRLTAALAQAVIAASGIRKTQE